MLKLKLILILSLAFIVPACGKKDLSNGITVAPPTPPAPSSNPSFELQGSTPMDALYWTASGPEVTRSSAASTVNGVTMPTDGGWMMQLAMDVPTIPSGAIISAYEDGVGFTSSGKITFDWSASGTLTSDGVNNATYAISIVATDQYMAHNVWSKGGWVAAPGTPLTINAGVKNQIVTPLPVTYGTVRFSIQAQALHAGACDVVLKIDNVRIQ